MKKLSSISALAFAPLIAALAMLGFSSPAQAYPDQRFDLTVDRSVLYGGESFTATASSQGATCTWTLEWNGVARQGSSSAGSNFVTSYEAPEVHEVTKIPLHGTCVYSSAGSRSSSSARGTATWSNTIVITVLPASTAVSPPGEGDSDLPSTGGPNLFFLLGGLGLLLAGATAVTVARRRAEEAEIHASGA